ncbi:hypothetical protein MMC17_007326 [Xylographa soralifera]|nr:hypothetical protein [Xylographa soralifera]
MDPLSISASAIAIAALATQVCKALARLRENCKTLPGRLHALNNEVADIKSVLCQVASVIQERASVLDSNIEQMKISQLLEQAEAKLKELKEIVNHLNRVCDCGYPKLQTLQSSYVAKRTGTTTISARGYQNGEVQPQYLA